MPPTDPPPPWRVDRLRQPWVERDPPSERPFAGLPVRAGPVRGRDGRHGGCFALASGQLALVNLHSAAGRQRHGRARPRVDQAHTLGDVGQQVRATRSLELMLANADSANLPRPLVKWSCKRSCAYEGPAEFPRAIHSAQDCAPGPVYLSIRYDEWDREAGSQVAHL